MWRPAAKRAWQTHLPGDWQYWGQLEEEEAGPQLLELASCLLDLITYVEGGKEEGGRREKRERWREGEEGKNVFCFCG